MTVEVWRHEARTRQFHTNASWFRRGSCGGSRSIAARARGPDILTPAGPRCAMFTAGVCWQSASNSGTAPQAPCGIAGEFAAGLDGKAKAPDLARAGRQPGAVIAKDHVDLSGVRARGTDARARSALTAAGQPRAPIQAPWARYPVKALSCCHLKLATGAPSMERSTVMPRPGPVGAAPRPLRLRGW